MEHNQCSGCGGYDADRTSIDGEKGCCCMHGPVVVERPVVRTTDHDVYDAEPVCITGWPHTEPDLWCREHTGCSKR